MKTIIDVKEFTFKYPNKEQIILDKINLEVNEGECCVLLGSNGSGKTTLIKCILGELNGNGEMTVAGFLPNIYNNMFKQKIGVVLDNDILPDYLTLKEYLFFVGKCYKIENKLLNDKINTIISQFGLKGNEDNLLRYFSHGMRKKAQIIRDQYLFLRPTARLFEVWLLFFPLKRSCTRITKCDSPSLSFLIIIFLFRNFCFIERGTNCI